MPTTSTTEVDIYTRGDSGALRQNDGTNDNAVLGWQGGIVYRTVAASTALTASSTETALDSYTIPANTLKAGTVIRVRFQGIATATNSTDTLTVKLYLGGLSGTAILTGTATDATNNDTVQGEAMIQIRTIGATGTMIASASGNIVPAATRVAVPVYQITASTTIDTTAALDVTVGYKWSTTSGSNSCRNDMFVVEMY